MVGKTSSDELQQPFVWTRGEGMRNLGPLEPGLPAAAFDINDEGLACGQSLGGECGLVAVVWDEDGPHDLQELLPPDSGWKLTSVCAINDFGQMIGSGLLDGESRDFVLTPAVLRVDGPVPGVAGQPNTVSVSGAEPGAALSFRIRHRPGAEPLRGCDGGAPVLLRRPRTIATAVADANGEATLVRSVPPAAAGRTFHVQVVSESTCSVSNVIAHTFR